MLLALLGILNFAFAGLNVALYAADGTGVNLVVAMINIASGAFCLMVAATV